jgi:type II secretory pathway pseudopilin PulG
MTFGVGRALPGFVEVPVSIFKRITVLSFVACLLVLAFQPSVDGARRLSDDEVCQQCIDRMNAAFNRTRPRIIAFGEGAVAKINQQQARNTRPATVQKTATTARNNIAKTQLSGNKTLESEAMKSVRELNRRNASSHLIDQINTVKSTGLSGLQMAADDCYAAINTALED